MAKEYQEGAKSLLIVAHGDLDGIVSAVLVARKYPERDIRATFVQPFTLDKVEVADDDEVVVVDVAVNNRNPQMTMDFTVRLGDRLLCWYDHHQGWELVDADDKFIIDSTAPSCAAVIGGDKTLVADATAADTRKGELSSRASLIEKATKANLADNSIREAAFAWLIGDESQSPILEAAAERYAAIQAETEQLSATYQATGNVALVDARNSNHQYDLTQLLLAGQKLAAFAVARVVNPAGEEFLTIATSDKEVNLVEVFDLGSGAPFRISIPASRLEEVLETLAAFRPCTCESGVHWANCMENSPYCG